MYKHLSLKIQFAKSCFVLVFGEWNTNYNYTKSIFFRSRYSRKTRIFNAENKTTRDKTALHRQLIWQLHMCYCKFCSHPTWIESRRLQCVRTHRPIYVRTEWQATSPSLPCINLIVPHSSPVISIAVMKGERPHM